MIVSIYAAFLALFYVGLSVRTLSLRRQLKIGVGDAGNERMLRAMRVHSNFSEYVPIALILAILVEQANTQIIIVHFVCAILLIGRCIHAFGVSKVQENYKFRVIGMAFTFTSICSSAFVLLGRAFLSF